MKKTPVPFFNARERRLLAQLRTPLMVQRHLNQLPYNNEPGGRATLRSFRGVVRHGCAHCLEAALFSAVALEQHGYPPLVLSFESIDELDHVDDGENDENTALVAGADKEDVVQNIDFSFFLFDLILYPLPLTGLFGENPNMF